MQVVSVKFKVTEYVVLQVIMLPAILQGVQESDISPLSFFTRSDIFYEFGFFLCNYRPWDIYIYKFVLGFYFCE